ncbi:putative protein serine/threonine kinase [Tieghemostelium lacteum]|uniref:Uncharacterized protein n=1 Tax=Tieghemostelium lacteum TaxID=361077 RepID=A0A152A1I6_TIELA|nr:putative protein serine/threonine kinase [Tieghemostelium lacteum]|eukprot:KYQ99976.1 putative protein serine/threonine kinase [Tieghemostelium lacteum]
MSKNSDSDNTNNSSDEESIQNEDEIEIISSGRELIKESNKIFQEIKDIEASKEFIEHGKSMVDTLLKRQEAKELMEKGMSMIAEVKQNKETKELLSECKDIVTFIKSEEKVQDIIEQCKEVIGQIKSKDSKPVEREQIEQLFSQGSKVFQHFRDNQQSSVHLERMKKMFFDLKEAETTRITIMNGIQDAKRWVDSLKEKDPEYRNIIEQGESIFNQLKNDQGVNEIVSDGKKILNDIMSPTSSHNSLDSGGGGGDNNSDGSASTTTSPEMIMSLIERSGKVAETVKTTLKQNKLVEEYSQRQDVKEFLEKGNKFIYEVKSKEQLIGFLKQNKDFIKEIKNTIVPFITDQLLKVQIPVVKGISKGFNYEISQLVFAGLSIPPEGVNVDFSESNTITVSVQDFKAQLKNFLWSYRQEGFPYLKDQGNASADCKNGFTSISFDIESRIDENTLQSHPEIKITEIVFKINQLDVIVEKGKALWLYNYLISKFSDSIKETVENKIKGTITTHLTSLTAKINNLVDQYWSKLISKLKNSTSPPPPPPPPTPSTPLTVNSETNNNSPTLVSENNFKNLEIKDDNN